MTLFGRRSVAPIVFLMLAVLHTWPLASAPGHLGRPESGDQLLNTWAVAWVAHQLPRDPIHVFDANIFFPNRRTLGYSEALIVQGAVAMPVIAAGGSAVLAYNLVLLVGLATSGWAFYWLVYRWTGSVAAAYAAGSAAAFNAHALTRLGHVQAQYVAFFAVALVALDAVFSRQRARDALLLGVAYAFHGLTSIYALTFATWALLFGALARSVSGPARRLPRVGLLLASGALVACVVLGPYLWQYVQVGLDMGSVRHADDNIAYPGSWSDYLSTGGTVHFEAWSRPFAERSMSYSFPGIMVGLLALGGLLLARGEARTRVLMAGAMAVGCALVSMAPHLPWFRTLHAWVPLFWTVRVIAHLGQYALLALAVMAGFGVAALQQRWGGRRGWLALAVLLVALVNVEACRAPFTFRRVEPIPPIYATLRDLPGVVVAELPFYSPRDFFGNAQYMVNSTSHWQPMLNGYSGMKPRSYDAAYAAAADFPSFDSVERLYKLGVTYIILHKREWLGLRDPQLLDDVARMPALRLVADDGRIAIYRLR